MIEAYLRANNMFIDYNEVQLSTFWFFCEDVGALQIWHT